MQKEKSYFFCGIGGSGMLPLALIVQGRGNRVAGSDRSLDQGRLAPKFEYLAERGIDLFAQDGSGVVDPEQILVTSAAVEDSVPDVVRARAIGARRINRPELLAELFNGADTGIAVGGTSGKSTVTGMIGWILHATGRDPTVMNGAVMKNFASPDAPFASALVGEGDAFVSEVDESDGSIALYRPRVAVLTNISLDHKSLDELRALFLGFAGKAEAVVLNVDDEETRLLAASLPAERCVGYGFADDGADLFGSGVIETPGAITFEANDRRTGATVPVALRLPGRHNAQNALAAIGAVLEIGISLADAAAALGDFEGLRRRLERVGTAGEVTIFDDFAHNPDKITATLRTLRAFPGRLLLFFQPHGFGPLRTMGRELVATFASEMGPEDVLIMPDPVYHGGTTSRDVGSEKIIAGVRDAGRQAEHIADRGACAERLSELAESGDRIVIMGARDDTLTAFAEELLARLRK
jgi:UDP-N-acetylmuramate--alanine ligase